MHNRRPVFGCVGKCACIGARHAYGHEYGRVRGVCSQIGRVALFTVDASARLCAYVETCAETFTGVYSDMWMAMQTIGDLLHDELLDRHARKWVELVSEDLLLKLIAKSERLLKPA